VAEPQQGKEKGGDSESKREGQSKGGERRCRNALAVFLRQPPGKHLVDEVDEWEVMKPEERKWKLVKGRGEGFAILHFRQQVVIVPQLDG